MLNVFTFIAEDPIVFVLFYFYHTITLPIVIQVLT